MYRFFGSGGLAFGVGFATAGTPTCNEYARTGSAMFLSCVGPRSITARSSRPFT